MRGTRAPSKRIEVAGALAVSMFRALQSPKLILGKYGIGPIDDLLATFLSLEIGRQPAARSPAARKMGGKELERRTPRKDNRMKSAVIMFVCLLAGTFTLANGQEAAQQPTPDNTHVNTRDRNSTEPTADQQKETKSDREIAQQVRQAIVKDKSLSTYGHNVKVIAQNGSVTLKGPVKSDEEKAAIETKAAAIVGKDNVNDRLEVKSKK